MWQAWPLPMEAILRAGRCGGNLFRAAEALGRDWLACGLRQQRCRDGVRVQQVSIRDTVSIGDGHLANGVHVFVGRVAALGGKRVRPSVGQAWGRVALKLSLRWLAAFGCFHLLCRQAILGIAIQNAASCLTRPRRIDPGRLRDQTQTLAGFRVELGYPSLAAGALPAGTMA